MDAGTKGGAAVSYPMHPKANQIAQMLLEMRQWKEIQHELGVSDRAVRRQSRRLEMIRVPVTREERHMLADRRKVTHKYVP